MLNYDMPLFRPPSEGRSVIIQATLGCSNNVCSFCAMYRTKKFSIRPLEDVLRDIDDAAQMAPHATKVFLADGDALVIPTPRLLPILERIRERFPRLERVTSYAMPRNLLRKSGEELRTLRAAGLSMLYYGMESGDPLILEKITKGATRDDMIESMAKAHEAGMELSVTVMLGLGGRKYSTQHIDGTASLLSITQPKFASALTLTIVETVADEFHAKFNEPFEELGIPELLGETERLVTGMEMRNTIFRSNHASNHLPIGGTLPFDKPALLALIARAKDDSRMLRPEWARGL